MKKEICFYPGSFDEFHEGHLHIAKKGLELFKTVIIVVANNEKKVYKNNLIQRKENICKKLKNQLNIVVVALDEKWMADYAKHNGLKYYIRGCRNKKDFAYEQNLFYKYKIRNKELELILFISDKQYINVSSNNS